MRMKAGYDWTVRTLARRGRLGDRSVVVAELLLGLGGRDELVDELLGELEEEEEDEEGEEEREKRRTWKRGPIFPRCFQS